MAVCRKAFVSIWFVSFAGLILGCSGAANQGGPARVAAGKVTVGGASSAANLPESPVQFREFAAAAGVKFTYRNGAEANHCAILESLGGGVALFDFDGDELPDALFP